VFWGFGGLKNPAQNILSFDPFLIPTKLQASKVWNVRNSEQKASLCPLSKRAILLDYTHLQIAAFCHLDKRIEAMRSYESARRSFGAMEFFAKALIVVGVLATIPAIIATEDRGPLALLGAVPGVAMMAMGFFGQAYAQTARASVDSAEYGQQTLALAREQLDISKQMLRLAQGTEPEATYTDEPAKTEDLPDISFDTEAPEVETTPPDRLHPYSGKKIEERAGSFQIDGKSYPTLNDAKLAVDGARHRAALAKA